jgi:hypothetical protein
MVLQRRAFTRRSGFEALLSSLEFTGCSEYVPVVVWPSDIKLLEITNPDAHIHG